MAEPDQPRAAGYFALTADWRLDGWCWFPDRPGERPEIDISVNGTIVHSCVASQSNDAVRAAGVGDGRYGFSLSIPAAAEGDAVVEARERRSGLILGRVTFGAGMEPTQNAVLARLSRQTGAWLAAQREPDARVLRIAQACEAFGADLAALGHPGRRRGWAATVRLRPRPHAPAVSLILLAVAWPETRAAVHHARALLPDMEILLVTSAAATIAAAGEIPDVRIVFMRGSRAAACNDAAARACGKMLCLVDNPRDFLAVGIALRLGAGAPILLGPDVAATLDPAILRWLPTGPADGIAAMLPCADLHAVGGFDARPDGGIDWASLAAKLTVLGRPIDARRSRPDAASTLTRSCGSLA